VHEIKGVCGFGRRQQPFFPAKADAAIPESESFACFHKKNMHCVHFKAVVRSLSGRQRTIITESIVVFQLAGNLIAKRFGCLFSA